MDEEKIFSKIHQVLHELKISLGGDVHVGVQLVDDHMDDTLQLHFDFFNNIRVGFELSESQLRQLSIQDVVSMTIKKRRDAMLARRGI
jgi:hypothetical protein